MVEIERNYVVPLRKEILKVPKYKRAKKAVTALRQFLEKHMKSEDIRIGKNLNLFLWQNGIKNPPTKVKIHVKKFKDGIVRAEIEGKPIEEPKEKEVKKEGLASKLEDLTNTKSNKSKTSSKKTSKTSTKSTSKETETKKDVESHKSDVKKETKTETKKEEINNEVNNKEVKTDNSNKKTDKAGEQ